jgi:hypothetical protein
MARSRGAPLAASSRMNKWSLEALVALIKKPLTKHSL